jgi:hypothetical protein
LIFICFYWFFKVSGVPGGASVFELGGGKY